MNYADLCVELVSEEQLGGYVERTLSVTIGKVCNAHSVLICGGFDLYAILAIVVWQVSSGNSIPHSELELKW